MKLLKRIFVSTGLLTGALIGIARADVPAYYQPPHPATATAQAVMWLAGQFEIHQDSNNPTSLIIIGSTSGIYVRYGIVAGTAAFAGLVSGTSVQWSSWQVVHGTMTVDGTTIFKSSIGVWGSVNSTGSFSFNGGTMSAGVVWPDGSIQTSAPSLSGVWTNKATADTSISSYSISFASSYGTIPGMTWPVMRTQLQPASSGQFTWDMYGTMYRSTGVCMGCWVPTTTKGWHPSSGAVLSFMFDESASTNIYDSINTNGIDASTVVGHSLSGRWVSISTGLNGERTAFEFGKSTGEIVFKSDSRIANAIGAGKASGCIAWLPYDLTLNSSLIWQGDTGDFGPQVGYGEFGSALGFIVNSAAGTALSQVKHQNTPNLNAWNTTCWRWDNSQTQKTQIWLNGVASNINSTEVGGTVNPGSIQEICLGARCDSRQIEQFNGMIGLVEFYLDNMTDARALAFDQIRRTWRTQR